MEDTQQCGECEALLANYIRALYVFQTRGFTSESDQSSEAQQSLQDALQPLLRHTSAHPGIQDRM